MPKLQGADYKIIIFQNKHDEKTLVIPRENDAMWLRWGVGGEDGREVPRDLERGGKLGSTVRRGSG